MRRAIHAGREPLFLALLCFFCFTRAQASDATPISFACSSPDQTRIVHPAADGSLPPLEVNATRPAQLEIEEDGLAITLDTPARDVRAVEVPPRYGWFFIDVDGRRTIATTRQQRGDLRGSLRVTLDCDPSPAQQRRLAWFAVASGLAQRLKDRVAEDAFPALMTQLDRLRADAPDAPSHALSLHLIAQAQLMNGHSVDASVAFTAAEQAWAALGDRGRAIAARVGRVEDMVRAGAYEAAVAATRSFPDLPSAESYFSVRLEKSRCLALTYLERPREADACYRWVLDRLDAIGEVGEYANTLQGYAGLQSDRGDFDKADEVVSRALDLAEGTDAVLTRGRLHVLLAHTALQRGHVVESLAESRTALAEFDQSHARRWQAVTLLKLAETYQALGADDEAYAFLAEAVGLLSARDAPSLMANAMLTFSDLERGNQHLGAALLWAHAAEDSYRNLKMTRDADDAHVDRLELQLQDGTADSVDAVAKELRAHADTAPSNAAQWPMLSAEAALRQHDPARARKDLDALRSRALALREQTALAQAEAQYWLELGDPQRAQRELFDAATRIDALSKRSRNPILRRVIALQMAPLRRMALQVVLTALQVTPDTASDPSAIDTVWDWIALSMAGPQSPVAATDNASPGAERFDRAVAAELLTPHGETASGAEWGAHRELLSILAQPVERSGSSAAATPRTRLAEVQHGLDADTALLAYVDGGARGALLWITRDQASLLDAASPDSVRAAMDSLRALVSSPDADAAVIDATARDVSTQLLHALSSSPPPRNLRVLADGSIDTAVWSVLPWPGSSTPMIATTNVSVIRIGTGDADSAHPFDGNIRVFVAAQESSTHSELPDLADATVEPAQIASAISDPAFAVDTAVHATRKEILAALGEPGAWIHVAAHGTAQPGRIGYAGVWLEPPSPGAQPEFLSWLDILDRGVRANLVVLDACRLGDSGDAIDGNVGFASAISQAGAEQVVAALWPVSDAASAIWVPAFYAAVSADPRHDAAAALRVAQQKLRASRMFRHPFYWAGLQAFARLDPPALRRHRCRPRAPRASAERRPRRRAR